MFGFRKVTSALAAATFGVAGLAATSSAPAEAQVFYGPRAHHYGHFGGYGGGFRPAYGYGAPGYYGYARPAYGYGYYPRRAWGSGYGYGGYGYGYPYGYYRHHDNGGAVAAGVIGGLALGALAANAARPVYYQRPAAYGYRDCWTERRRVAYHHGHAVVRRVRVCQ